MQSYEDVKSASEVQIPAGLPMNMSEAELNDLFASCLPRLRRAAGQMLRNSEDCEDALQEGLLSAFRNIDQFQGRSKFSTWLHSIVRNAVRMHLRKVKSQPVWLTAEAEDKEMSIEERSIDAGPNPEQICAQRERSRILISAMRGLSPRYRTALQLCDVEGLEGKDAARKMGIPLAALKTYLFRGRRMVSQRIRGRYLRRRCVFVAPLARTVRIKRRYASGAAGRIVQRASAKSSGRNCRSNQERGGAELYSASLERSGGTIASPAARLACEANPARAKSKPREWEVAPGFPVSSAVSSNSLPAFPC